MSVQDFLYEQSLRIILLRFFPPKDFVRSLLLPIKVAHEGNVKDSTLLSSAFSWNVPYAVGGIHTALKRVRIFVAEMQREGPGI